MIVPVSVQVPTLGALFSRIQDQMPALKSTEASKSEPARRGGGLRAIRDGMSEAHLLGERKALGAPNSKNRPPPTRGLCFSGRARPAGDLVASALPKPPFL